MPCMVYWDTNYCINTIHKRIRKEKQNENEHQKGQSRLEIRWIAFSKYLIFKYQTFNINVFWLLSNVYFLVLFQHI